jgi:hypothetical protein
MFTQTSLPGIKTRQEPTYGFLQINNFAENGQPSHSQSFYRDYKAFDPIKTRRSLESHYFSPIFGMSDLDKQVRHFNSIILSVFQATSHKTEDNPSDHRNVAFIVTILIPSCLSRLQSLNNPKILLPLILPIPQPNFSSFETLMISRS